MDRSLKMKTNVLGDHLEDDVWQAYVLVMTIKLLVVDSL